MHNCNMVPLTAKLTRVTWERLYSEDYNIYIMFYIYFVVKRYLEIQKLCHGKGEVRNGGGTNKDDTVI